MSQDTNCPGTICLAKIQYEYIRIFVGIKISYSSYYGSVTNIRIFEYIRIFSATNICSYHIRILFLIHTYIYIRSYHFFDPNIFGYLFVSFFWYKYIQIFVEVSPWKCHQLQYPSFTPSEPAASSQFGRLKIQTDRRLINKLASTEKYF